MHTNRGTRGFLAILVTACGLVLGVFSSPVAAKTIVVTTNQDTVDPPFTPSGLCGTGTLADLPGADGRVSLREAVIAANNAPGAKTIQFAPNLSGTTIVLTHSLALCGGHTTLTGDVNGDNTPDITIDGRAVLFPFDVISLFSSHNTVKSLRVLAPGDPGVGGIVVAATPAVATTVVGNTITHNIVTGGSIFVLTGLNYSANGQSFNAATIKHTRVRANTVLSAPVAGIIAIILGDQHEMTDLTIIGNTVSGNPIGILALGGEFNERDPNDDGATDNRLDVTIKDNLVTGNSNPGATAGIAITGGAVSSSHNQVTAAILDNTLNDNNGNGISVVAGLDNSSQNRVAVKIRGNTLENNAGVGIFTFGAVGALFSPSGESAGNTLDARIEHNTVQNAFLFGIGVTGGIGGFDSAPDKVAENNAVNAIVRDNTVNGTNGEGIHVDAGGSGAANANTVDVRVEKNTVCSSTPPNADIHAIGGLQGNAFLPDNTGTGNVLTGEIVKNTATTVTVQDGVSGNTADVTQFKNEPCP
jgi:hypothetical protein